MGFGFGGRKGNSRKRIGAGAVRPIGRRVRPIGDGVKPIDRPIGAIDRPISGMTGVKGRVGRNVKSINRKVKNSDDIFDVKF